MLSRSERDELMKRIHDYAAAEAGVLATADTSRRLQAVDRAAEALARLIEYVEEEIS